MSPAVTPRLLPWDVTARSLKSTRPPGPHRSPRVRASCSPITTGLQPSQAPSSRLRPLHPPPPVLGNQTAAPGAAATPDPAGTMAFVTETGPPGSEAASFDVDGGPTYLVSPIIDLAGSESVVSYARWAFTRVGVDDALTVEVSDDGGDTWVLVESVTDTFSVWETATFVVGDYVALTSALRVRFGVCDCPNDSVTEAGIDDFQVTAICAAGCLADLDGDGEVGITDFLELLANWGSCT